MDDIVPDPSANVAIAQLRMALRAIGPLMALRRFPTVPTAVFALRVRRQLKQLRRVTKDLDAFDAIANMTLASTPLDVETYKESEFAESMATPEVAALAFAERNPGRLRKSRPNSLSTLHDLIPKLLMSSVLRLMFDLQRKRRPGAKPEVVPRLKHAMVSRELHLRNARFYEEEVALLKELFGGDTRAALLDRLGFAYEEMQTMYDSLGSFVLDAVTTSIRETAEALEREVVDSRELQSVLDTHPDGRDAAIGHVAGVATFSKLSSLAALSVEKVTELTGLSPETVAQMLDRLSIDLDVRHKGLVKDFLDGANPFRTHPFMKRRGADGLYEWLLVQPTWLIYGMRELFESALTAEPMDQAYMKHRGSVLERRGLSALVRSLRPELALTNLEYVDEAGKRWESDGLVLVGDTAIIVEAKSNRLTPYARSGGATRLWSELKPIISKAAEQAERLRSLIEVAAKVHIRSSSEIDAAGSLQPPRTNWDLDLSGVREIDTVALSLEDLNFVATITSELIDSGLIEANAPAPWIVNIHDLEVISEILDRPSELVHFISRRRRASDTNRVLANDELDYLMHYISNGLYTDEPSDETEMVTSLTDPLDEWHSFKHGHRKTFAPKPAQPINNDLGELLDLLEKHRPYGWLPASLALLEMDIPQREAMGSAPRILRQQTRRDRLPHSSFTGVQPPKSEPFGVIAMSFARSESPNQIEGRFLAYATARKYASTLSKVFAFGAWQGSSLPFDMFLCLDDQWEHDDELEALVDSLNLRRPDADIDV